MNVELIGAIISITLALILYTLGVFRERKSGALDKVSLIFFYLGLAGDTTGTTIMANIAQNNVSATASSAFSLHAVTGGLAIIFMLFHALWATVVMIKKNEAAKKSFHKFSGIVWCFWLVPYVCGLFIGSGMLSASYAVAISIGVALVAYVGLIRPKPHNKR